MAEPAILPASSDRSEAEAPRSDVQAFERFIRFFDVVFSRPGFLDGVGCSDYIRSYVPHYYRKTFGQGSGLDQRHFRWFLRLQPLLALPRGSRLVDYGGGYGLDSIFLAALGYQVTFFEITLSHIAVAEHLKRVWEEAHGPIGMRSILRSHRGGEDFGEVDAVFLDEAAHHIEPVQAMFLKCFTILDEGGRLFLLEPNSLNPLIQAYFFKVRGLKTTLSMKDPETGRDFLYGNEHIRPFFRWNRIARRCGFEPERIDFIVPYGISSEAGMRSPVRALLARTPVLKHLAASHLTLVYRRI